MEAAGILHEDEHIELLDGEIFRMAAMVRPPPLLHRLAEYAAGK